MSIPLDNLYNWIDGLLPAPACVYVFRPHGSKNISDLLWLKNYNIRTKWQLPGVIIHDQEPLDWDLYNCPRQWQELWNKNLPPDRWKEKFESEEDLKREKDSNDSDWIFRPPEYFDIRFKYCSQFNLRSEVLRRNALIYDQTVLIHSEKNSKDLSLYENNGFICVHYWAHALIAQDWYRFADYDVRLEDQQNQPKYVFLIYCRDWSHRREYRLKFLELLINANLYNISQVSMMHTNSNNIHFSTYKFQNPQFELHDPQLLTQIPQNNFTSTSSADYNANDFVSTQISVVLETVFDGTRIHLTEKILRPIACGHPFILAAGPGALEYLRSYGFQTYDPWIDESYDKELDSVVRMQKIIESMKTIHNLQGKDRENFFNKIKSIAQFNKMHFFSSEFSHKIKSELKDNLESAMKQVARSRGKYYLEHLTMLKKNKLLDSARLFRRLSTQCVRQLRQSCQDDQSSLDPNLAV